MKGLKDTGNFFGTGRRIINIVLLMAQNSKTGYQFCLPQRNRKEFKGEYIVPSVGVDEQIIKDLMEAGYKYSQATK